MSSTPQTISVDSKRIVPIQLKPVADILLVVPGRSSRIDYCVGKFIPGKPEVPGKPAVPQKSGPGLPGYVPYQPPVLAIPAVPDTVIPIEQGSIDMTDEEWDAWGDGDDVSYRASIVASRLGLTFV